MHVRHCSPRRSQARFPRTVVQKPPRTLTECDDDDHTPHAGFTGHSFVSSVAETWHAIANEAKLGEGRDGRGHVITISVWKARDGKYIRGATTLAAHETDRRGRSNAEHGECVLQGFYLRAAGFACDLITFFTILASSTRKARRMLVEITWFRVSGCGRFEERWGTHRCLTHPAHREPPYALRTVFFVLEIVAYWRGRRAGT